GVSSKEIFVTTDNGSIRQNQEKGAGHYIYHPIIEGHAKIYVKRRINNETIDSMNFRVRRVPIQRPMLAGKSKGAIPHLRILTQLGIIAPSVIHDDKWFPVKSYSITVTEKGNKFLEI